MTLDSSSDEFDFAKFWSNFWTEQVLNLELLVIHTDICLSLEELNSTLAFFLSGSLERQSIDVHQKLTAGSSFHICLNQLNSIPSNLIKIRHVLLDLHYFF